MAVSKIGLPIKNNKEMRYNNIVNPYSWDYYIRIGKYFPDESYFDVKSADPQKASHATALYHILGGGKDPKIQTAKGLHDTAIATIAGQDFYKLNNLVADTPPLDITPQDSATGDATPTQDGGVIISTPLMLKVDKATLKMLPTPLEKHFFYDYINVYFGRSVTIIALKSGEIDLIKIPETTRLGVSPREDSQDPTREQEIIHHLANNRGDYSYDTGRIVGYIFDGGVISKSSGKSTGMGEKEPVTLEFVGTTKTLYN